jgi:hypothetical protein
MLLGGHEDLNRCRDGRWLRQDGHLDGLDGDGLDVLDQDHPERRRRRLDWRRPEDRQ